MSGEFMRRSFITLFILGFLLVSQNVNAQKFVTVKVLQPLTPFDFKLAADMINSGSSQIIGKAYFETKAGLLRREIEPNTYAKPENAVSLYTLI